MTLEQVKQTAEAQVNGFWSKLRVEQGKLLAAHGRYWQGLAPCALPAHDSAALRSEPADESTAAPGHDPWSAMHLPLPAALAAQVAVHELSTPAYEVEMRLTFDGVEWRAFRAAGDPAWSWQSLEAIGG